MIRAGLRRSLSLARKGWKVLAFRGWQELRLRTMGIDGWKRIARAAGQLDEDHAAVWLQSVRAGRGLVVRDGATIYRSWAAHHPESVARLRQQADAMAAGRFEIFDQPATFSLGAIPWLEDWRYRKVWESKYFRDYRFYEQSKPFPYDVKWPWELSRLGWMVTLAQASALGWAGAGQLGRQLLLDWEARNPVAQSVNWMPMEASIRAINLAVSAAMLAVDPATTPAMVLPWLRQLMVHREFVARVVEWTDVNNNHYIANLAALAVVGRSLGGLDPRAEPGAQWAEGRLWKETLAEFFPDGVNYEMALGYHRLVTELGILAVLSARRADVTVPVEVTDRLAAAVRYLACARRPDGWIPAVGDNDSSRVLTFDQQHTRDPAEALALGTSLFGLNVTEGVPSSAAVPWLLGESGETRSMPECGILVQFPDGGSVIVRAGGNYLFVDLGDVGLKGRGGHGHNDALGFELSLAGTAVLIDPGTSGYTADLARHREGRSTASHNVLQVDQAEQAPILGPWEIGNQAAVTVRRAQQEGGVVRITGSHAGYTHLADPVQYKRQWLFDPAAGSLEVHDRLECAGEHRCERFLHLAAGLEAIMGEDESSILLPAGRVRIRWDRGTVARLKSGWVADSYGTERAAQVIVLEDLVTGSSQLQFRVELVDRPDGDRA